MKISIIIPTFNRVQLITNLLESLYADEESQRAADIEIIVADDCSTDGTADVIRNKYPDVVVVSGPGKSSPKNKRAGIEASTGDYIVNLDDDCTPRKGWIAAAMPYLLRGEKLVQSKIIFYDLGQTEAQDESPDNFFVGYRWDMMPIMTVNGGFKERYIPLCHEFGVFVSRDILRTHPFDDPNIMGDVGESASFSIRVQKDGHRIFFNPNSIIDHWGAELGGTADRGRKAPKKECTEYASTIVHNFVLFCRILKPFRLLLLVPYYFFGSFYLSLKQRRPCYRYLLKGVFKGLTRKLDPVIPYNNFT